jgi:hypothetical protein
MPIGFRDVHGKKFSLQFEIVDNRKVEEHKPPEWRLRLRVRTSLRVDARTRVCASACVRASVRICLLIFV